MDARFNVIQISPKTGPFRSKLLIPWNISRLGLFLPILRYVIDRKRVKSVGFVFHSSRCCRRSRHLLVPNP